MPDLHVMTQEGSIHWAVRNLGRRSYTKVTGNNLICTRDFKLCKYAPLRPNSNPPTLFPISQITKLAVIVLPVPPGMRESVAAEKLKWGETVVSASYI